MGTTSSRKKGTRNTEQGNSFYPLEQTVLIGASYGGTVSEMLSRHYRNELPPDTNNLFSGALQFACAQFAATTVGLYRVVPRSRRHQCYTNMGASLPELVNGDKLLVGFLLSHANEDRRN